MVYRGFFITNGLWNKNFWYVNNQHRFETKKEATAFVDEYIKRNPLPQDQKNKILKGTLLRRRLIEQDGECVYTKQTKQEAIDEVIMAMLTGDYKEEDLDSWIESLKADLAKTPEQRAEEENVFLEEIDDYEPEEIWTRERDEWDDLWNDRARSCGAKIYF